MDKDKQLRTDRRAKQASLSIQRGSGIGRALLKVIRKARGKTSMKSEKGLQTEGKTGGEQAGRANLSRIPQQRFTRTQARGLGAGPHDSPDPGEGTEKDVMTAQEKLAKLKAMERTATGMQLGKIQKFIKHLQTGAGKSQAQNQSTEINMNGYERIFEMFINEVAGGTPSHKAPGHEERMKAHTKRIQSHPDYAPGDPSGKERGAKGAEKTNKKKGKK
jgi:hypothetical protein